MRLGARAIQRLVRKFDETIALAVWANHGPAITLWEPASASDTLPVGLTLPVTSTATGLAFAAHLPYEAIAQAVWPDQTDSLEEKRDWEEAAHINNLAHVFEVVEKTGPRSPLPFT
jgi:DNA-binding IclR family transcriptional regulator